MNIKEIDKPPTVNFSLLTAIDRPPSSEATVKR